MNAAVRASLRPRGVAVIYTTCSLFASELRAGKSMPHRTATAVGSAIAGTDCNDGVSLIVAARPSAGRSPVREHCAESHRPSRGQIGYTSSTRRLQMQLHSGTPHRSLIGVSSGTLPLVNTTPILKVSRRSSSANVSAAKARAAARTASPNPSIERTRSGSAGSAFISFWAKPAPPPRAAHVKR